MDYLKMGDALPYRLKNETPGYICIPAQSLKIEAA
jgi:hypothetical protein